MGNSGIGTSAPRPRSWFRCTAPHWKRAIFPKETPLVVEVGVVHGFSGQRKPEILPEPWSLTIFPPGSSVAKMQISSDDYLKSDKRRELINRLVNTAWYSNQTFVLAARGQIAQGAQLCFEPLDEAIDAAWLRARIEDPEYKAEIAALKQRFLKKHITDRLPWHPLFNRP